MNTQTDITNLPIVYKGQQILDRGDKLSLTSMFKAAGSPANQDPAQWLRSATAEAFIEAVSINMGKSHNELLTTYRGGKAPGTWAHWQIALAYAKYLSPEFHMVCNQIVRDKMVGKAQASQQSLTPYDISIIGNMIKNCTGVMLQEHFGSMVAQTMPALVHAYIAQNHLMVRKGKTANEIMLSYGFPAGIKNLARWFGNRLDAVGCRQNGTDKADFGSVSVRVYDPDKADAWMRNGGKLIVSKKVAERLGQASLRLVTGRAA